MDSRTNETREFSARSVQDASECVAFARDRVAFLSDVFEGDGLVRTRDFQLSVHGANAVSEMLLEMQGRLDHALELLKADYLRVGAE
ncbi:MAG: hypothetical protein K6E40_13805 [Desulfovibrio sp.]|nr:hypothetical protein [Desulfovibrio sp.]